MATSDSVSDKKKNERKPPTAQSEISITSIPQIVLTEPAQNTSQLSTIEDDKTDVAASPYTLSPPSPNKQQQSAIPPPTPLPLTKDLLQRKNKLDRLLLQKERLKRLQQKPSTDFYSANSAVDERVTAGLGITTPNNPSRNVPEKSSTAFSPIASEWSYDLDVFKSTISGSSKGGREKRQQPIKTITGTSVSGSSIHNSASVRAYSANHRYMDRNNQQYHRAQHFERPEQSIQKSDAKSKYYLLDILYQAANRVVNSRAPESEQVSNNEVFDFKSQEEQPHSPAVMDIASAAATAAAAAAETNEKIIESTSPEVNANSACSLKQSSKNRYSWLSFASSLDEKSEFDQDSIVLEKKPTNKTTEETPIPSHNIPSSLNYTIPNPLQGHSLCLFGPRNPFRIFVWSLIRKR
ncbi:uncharacterized protein B0P05DRAFT_67616 [Gilbertella persicaria]|uniref:uncharacterized protein n=1 Tax=Gilbertella persicaria TaxID=101096 RepID=UPI0022202D74|nr:uncharacterized protein B0P05DRAFT_67616 [Gilbertella persicaria]KAI8081968.1 hypothetical protein B0P05DRAFT_67616 [Gilbertella persicaria]